LGSPNALYLSAAGVGTLGLVDFDVVDHTNLHRQVIHGTNDVGKLKVESAREAIRDINPNVTVKTYNLPFNRDVAMDIASHYDLVIDGTDNFQTRYLTNDTCVFLKKPNVYASIFRFDGQATVFNPKDRRVPATAVSIRNRLRRGKFRLVRRGACWAFFRGWWDDSGHGDH
jgi:molybdopterin/thiamine biosynthesis adenylyltransferase